MSGRVDPPGQAEARIAARVSDYVAVLTGGGGVDAARDYYTEDARLLGPGFDLDRDAVLREIGAAFEAGARIEVERRTLEFIRWGRGSDGEWRFARVLLSPVGG